MRLRVGDDPDMSLLSQISSLSRLQARLSKKAALTAELAYSFNFSPTASNVPEAPAASCNSRLGPYALTDVLFSHTIVVPRTRPR